MWEEDYGSALAVLIEAWGLSNSFASMGPRGVPAGGCCQNRRWVSLSAEEGDAMRLAHRRNRKHEATEVGMKDLTFSLTRAMERLWTDHVVWTRQYLIRGGG